jgi:methyl-accepting chemotaxis protein
MARVERAAATLEDLGPDAATVAATLADVTRRLAELGEQYGPALTQLSDGVASVTGDLQDLADDLRPLASTLGLVSEAIRSDGPGNDVADALSSVQQAMNEVTDTVDGVAGTTADVAEQVRVLTSPETLALVAEAADAVDGLAALSDQASDLAGGYVDNARTFSAVAQVVAVLSVVGSVVWLVWRVGEHRRWLVLRRADTGAAVLAAVQQRRR